MNMKLTNEIASLIQSFNDSLQLHLPALEKDIKMLIDKKSTDTKTIEHYLDTLLSLTMHGIGDKLFVQVLD